jgi:hypothetical protein
MHAIGVLRSLQGRRRQRRSAMTLASGSRYATVNALRAHGIATLADLTVRISASASGGNPDQGSARQSHSGLRRLST